MSKKVLLVLILMVFAMEGMAISKPVKQKAAEKPIQKVIQKIATEELVGKDDFADYTEATNNALAEMKAKVDKVAADNSDAKVSALIFFRWQKYVQNGTATTPNNFDVDRAYLDVKKKLSSNMSARMTLDVARITGAARQNLFDYLKYAYVEMPTQLSFMAKVGLQQTMWIDWADKQLNLRYIAKSLLDNQGVMSSSDFGLGALGKISIGSLPEIEYHATLLNGTGYATNESDSNKAIALRINSTVYSNDSRGKIILGLYENAESNNMQGGGAISYQHNIGRVFCEYVAGSKNNKDIAGYSIGGVFDFGKLVSFMPGYSLFARIDGYRPETSKNPTDSTSGEQKKTFYGITYDWGKDVKYSLDLQTAQTGSGTITGILYLHSQIVM